MQSIDKFICQQKLIIALVLFLDQLCHNHMLVKTIYNLKIKKKPSSKYHTCKQNFFFCLPLYSQYIYSHKFKNGITYKTIGILLQTVCRAMLVILKPVVEKKKKEEKYMFALNLTSSPGSGSFPFFPLSLLLPDSCNL